MLKGKGVPGLLLLISATGMADEPGEQQAREFFRQFVSAMERYDPTITNFYADDAVIRVRTVLGNDEQRLREVSGVEWKAALLQALPLAKHRRDSSTFSQVTVIPEAQGYRIQAQRYSPSNCFTDQDYTLVIEPAAQGQWQIVEEPAASRVDSNC